MRARAVCSVLALLTCAATLWAPGWAVADTLPPSEWVIGPRKPVVLLTFEGQTKAEPLRDLLATLKEKGVRATFFFSGEWIQTHPRRAERVLRAGHLLGNRGYGPERFTELDDSALAASIERATDVLREVGSYPRPFLRTPDGARDLRVLQVAGSLGYRSVGSTYHAGGGLAGKVAGRVARNARWGSIITLDTWRTSHRRALPILIERLRSKGLGFRTVKTLENVHPIRWDVTVRSGSAGPEVAYLERTLRRISYPGGKADGNFDDATLQAVYAFEKVKGLARDGVVPPEQMRAIALASRPVRAKRAPGRFIEIDISRQVLFEVVDGKVTKTLPISSGNEGYYSVDGQTYRSHTPRGEFTIERKIPGWRTSRLGRLWYPSYFVGGFAIHGSTSVPTYPASHGCVRLPMYVTVGFYNRNPMGTPTFVHD
ncbi:MAG: polysaccharide deacetylase family protein [Actinomycetota bacterium]